MAGGPFAHLDGVTVLHAAVLAVDCGKYSEDSTSPECQERQEIGLGVMVVGALVLLVVGWVVWRWLLRRSARRTADRSADPGAS